MSKGTIQVICGEGKGKTTAALGMGISALLKAVSYTHLQRISGIRSIRCGWQVRLWFPRISAQDSLTVPALPREGISDVYKRQGLQYVILAIGLGKLIGSLVYFTGNFGQ